MRTTAPLQSLDHATSAAAAARRTLVALSFAVALCSVATAALAQGAVPCTAIENDAERLACYDRALRPAAPAAPAPAPSASRAAPAAPPAAAAPAAPEAEESRRERRVRESTAAAPPAPAPAPAAPAAPRAGASTEPSIVPVVIVGLRALPGRETTFTTDDGAIWVQTDSQRLVGLPETPFDAEIRPGAMGSYFLVPDDRGRAIRVRRFEPR